MTVPVPSSTARAVRRELSVTEVDRAGLLHADSGVMISRYAIFMPDDELGTARVITVRASAVIGPFAVIHGGTTLGEQARLEDHTVAGKPELGYALDGIHPGRGG